MNRRTLWLLLVLLTPVALAQADAPQGPVTVAGAPGVQAAPPPPPPLGVGDHSRPRWAALTLGALQIVVVFVAVGVAVIGPTRPNRRARGATGSDRL
jgi:hypothetical protein